MSIVSEQDRDIHIYRKDKKVILEPVPEFVRDILIAEAPVPKDIDIWFFSSMSIHDVWKALDGLFPGGEQHAALVAEPGSIAYKYARAIFKWKIRDRDIDFILLPTPIKDPLQVLDRFDLTVCQAAWDGVEWVTTPGFVEAKNNRVLKLTDAAYERDDLGRIVHDRLPKFRAKFPDWSEEPMPDVAPQPPSASQIGFHVAYFGPDSGVAVVESLNED